MSQKKGLKRNVIDKYYTNKDIASYCIELVKKYINISNNDLIIEPSAGSGSFIEYIKTLSDNYKFYDLEPEHDEIIKQDFLKLEPIYDKAIHIIGNPPFGRQSSLAIKFIKKCSFANSISFILPKSFKKDSMKKAFDLHFHLIHEIDLPSNSFTINNETCDVHCIFQIWIKKCIERTVPIKEKEVNFKFVKKSDNPDISFRRVGVNAGVVSTDTNKSEQSHYFIKLNNKEKINELNNIRFNFNNTVGPKSISKPELIHEFNKILS